MRVALVLLLALARSVVPAAQGEDVALAPDGRRGLGAPTTVDKLLKQFRMPDEAEEQLHRELRDLVRDVNVLVSLAEGFYRERGYFEMLEPLQDPSLPVLHAAFAGHLANPAAIVARGGTSAETFARVFLDPRFRVRKDVIEGWEDEARQMLGGLDVLAAAANGLVVLDDVQATNIARRVDLAAAQVRAVFSDLSSLREPMEAAHASGVDPKAVDALLALFEIEDVAEREARVAEAMAREEAGAQRMAAVLFTTRFRAKAAAELAARTADDARAQALLAEARTALPDETETDTPNDVNRLSKTKRLKLAREKAVEGLASDPLNDELAWIAAETSRVVFGEVEMASHYDRYLALHGIVHYDDRTYRERQLTERETTALFYVQEFERKSEQATEDQ